MKELHVLIKKGDYKFPVEISKESKDLIQKLLVLNPADRLSIPEVLAHPWVKEDDDEEEEDEEGEEKEEREKEEKKKKNNNLETVLIP